jgi:hypothetical protein
VIAEMREERRPFDLVTVTAYAREHGRLKACGGTAHISNVFNCVPVAFNWRSYLEGVLIMHRRNQTVFTLTDALGKLNNGVDADGVLSLVHNVRTQMDSLLADASGETPQKVVVRSLKDFVVNDDRWLCGGGAVLLAGPTGIGKSSLAMQAAISWALGRPLFGTELPHFMKSRRNSAPWRGTLRRAHVPESDATERVPPIWGSSVFGIRPSRALRVLQYH